MARPDPPTELHMDRKVPLWFFLLCMLFALLAMVAFGWTVRSSLSGSKRTGSWGKVAVEIAHFPSTANMVIRELLGYVSEDYQDARVRVPRDDFDLSRFRPVQSKTDRSVDGLLAARVEGKAEDVWRLLIGAFWIDDDLENAALLLSPSLDVTKVWIFDEAPIEGITPRHKERKFIHGVAVLDDASLIFSFDAGVSLQRIDRCGRRQWAIGGEFHHAVNLDDFGHSVWTLGDGLERPTQVAVEDGSILRSFSMEDVVRANPDIDILELRRVHQSESFDNRRNTDGKWYTDPFHLNDAEPLPAAIAGAFPDFAAGDLLISARAINLLFVVDPEDLKVKWWRIGATQRQHDPDWQPNGEITVYNNRLSRDYSEIVAIDPSTFSKRIVYDGRRSNFYSRIRGKHEVLPSGHIIVSSPQQGRTFEVDETGEIVLEIMNTKPGSDDENYVISELKRLSPETVEAAGARCD